MSLACSRVFVDYAVQKISVYMSKKHSVEVWRFGKDALAGKEELRARSLGPAQYVHCPILTWAQRRV